MRSGILGPIAGGVKYGLVSSLLWLAATGAAHAQGLVAPVSPQAAPAAQQPPKPETPPDLLDLPLERLADQPVRAPAAAAAGDPLALGQVASTVSRQESTLGHSAAALFIITNDMIRRSGATSIPEVLRMVPGLNVARVDSSRWAVTSRGFNSRLTDKLLVQIDGRTIYNPIFSGVFWEVQNLLLQDVERIEVIRGPGATVWGANAVNGVINIITKSAKDTQGGLLTGGGGTRDQGTAGIRYGGKIGDDLYYRVWGKWSEGGTFFDPLGPGHDDWRQGHGGFRLDWEPTECDTVTLQGELFQSDLGRTDIRAQPNTPPFRINIIGDDYTTGANVLSRWRHKLGERSDWELLVYYDNFDRTITNGLTGFAFNTFDVDFHQQFPLTDRQQLNYGLGYRFIDISFQPSSFDNGFNLTPDPSTRQVSYYSAFVQDEFTLVKDRLFFTAGCKFLENDWSGFEYQPSGRFLWTPDQKHSAWAAISRAVRTPNYIEQNLQNTLLPAFPASLNGAPLFPRLINNRDLLSEDLLAYELGYRAQATDTFSYDLALFYNVYDNLSTARPGKSFLDPLSGSFLLPTIRENGLNAESYGAELAANWRLTECWRVYGNYTWLQINTHRAAGLPESAEAASEGQSPHHQVYLQSSWDLPHHLELDLIGRYVDRLPGFAKVVQSYFSLDARLGWKPRPNLEIAVVGQNLLDSTHLETGAIALVPFPLIEVPRGVYGTVTLRW